MEELFFINNINHRRKKKIKPAGYKVNIIFIKMWFDFLFE